MIKFDFCLWWRPATKHQARLCDQIPYLSAAGVVGDTPSCLYDYCEKAEDPSTVDTPDSGHWELPFAKDSLGETVIHLDKARTHTFPCGF